MKFIKKLFLLLLPVIFAVNIFGAADPTPLPKTATSHNLHPKSDDFMVRFSTIIPANTTVLLAGTQTATSNYWAPGITFSTNPVSTCGGRINIVFQVQNAANNVYVDLTNSISTTTSMYLTQKDIFSPDDPIAYQGPVYVRSTTTATITGYLWFDRNWR